MRQITLRWTRMIDWMLAPNRAPWFAVPIMLAIGAFFGLGSWLISLLYTETVYRWIP